MSANQTIYPIGWELRELSDVATVIDCKHVTAQFVPDGFPVISIGELGGRFIDLENGPRTTHDYYALLAEGARRPQTGDIIMARNATIGRCSLVPETDVPFAMGQDVCLVRPKKGKLYSDFLKLVLGSPSFARQFEFMMAGSTFKRLNVQQVKKLMVLTPSLNEQERIAQMIVSVEAHAGTLKRLIAKKRDVKKGMMQELLTGRTRLPGFSGEWREMNLGDVALIDPEALSPLTTPPGEVIDYIALEDVSEGVLVGSSRMLFREAPSRARRRVERGDVLFGTVRPNLRSHCLYRSGLYNPVASTGFAVIRSRSAHTEARYLAQWVHSKSVTDQVQRIVAGSNYPAVSSTDVRSFEVHLPPVEEQFAIGQVLANADAEIEALEQRLESARALKTGMMQELLTGRTRLPVEEDT